MKLLISLITLTGISAPCFSAVTNTPSDTTQTNTELIHASCEEMPVFPKGNISKWVRSHFRYPKKKLDISVTEGKIFVQFVIEKDGSVKDAKVLRGLHPLLDKEAVRVVKSMPRWRPALYRGEPARCSYTLPISIDLPNQEKAFTTFDEDPYFPQGDPHIWLCRHIRYPEMACELHKEGTVLIRFIIEKNGTLSHIQVARKAYPSLDAEALRAVKSMPQWIPGKVNGQVVRSKYTLPITFRLSR
ncbi:MAG: energy transducer TonB [Odoribacter sp.]|nr:energy transducer TonB [Odoribacter sp.]